SGRFEILFALWSETAPDDEFVRAYAWTPGVMEVTVELAAHEAIGAYWLQSIGSCPPGDWGGADGLGHSRFLSRGGVLGRPGVRRLGLRHGPGRLRRLAAHHRAGPECAAHRLVWPRHARLGNLARASRHRLAHGAAVHHRRCDRRAARDGAARHGGSGDAA